MLDPTHKTRQKVIALGLSDKDAMLMQRDALLKEIERLHNVIATIDMALDIIGETA